jgi:hypothetical protein
LSFRPPHLGYLAWALLLAAAATAQADVVRLRNGGEVRGQVDAASRDPAAARVVVETLTGGRIVLDRAEVEFVTPRSLDVEDYETRARGLPDTIEAHRELAEWCRERRLIPQRQEQLELLLDLEPDDVEARRILGHERHNGQWMTRDEWMRSRGYVKHKGKYVTQQELDLLEKSQAEREAEQAWYPKVRMWFGWATGNNPQRAVEGLANLQAISDPDSVPALANFMGDDESDNVRLTCVQILGKLGGPKPVPLLVRKTLLDDSDQVRSTARAGIRADQYELALEYFVPELKHDSNRVVQRAAAAIGEMGNVNTVPYLIEALVTTHRWKIEVPANTSVAVGVSPDGQVGMPSSSTSSALPAEVELLARTGQLPYGAIVLPPPFQMRRTRTVTIKGDVKNEAVLAALQKLTGQNFGFSEHDWRLWWAEQARG